MYLVTGHARRQCCTSGSSWSAVPSPTVTSSLAERRIRGFSNSTSIRSSEPKTLDSPRLATRDELFPRSPFRASVRLPGRRTAIKGEAIQSNTNETGLAPTLHPSCYCRRVDERELTEATGLGPAASCVTGRRPKPGCSCRQPLRGSFNRRCESIKDKRCFWCWWTRGDSNPQPPHCE